jgi:hypothetical protein
VVQVAVLLTVVVVALEDTALAQAHLGVVRLLKLL